jgi:hypothetical protein
MSRRVKEGTEGIIPADAVNGNGTMRTTVLLPIPLNVNLELFALKTGEPKGEVIRKALTEYLGKNGFEPTRLPEITYRWREVPQR